MAALDASLARGLADANAGRTRPADQVFDRLAAKYRALGSLGGWAAHQFPSLGCAAQTGSADDSEEEPGE